MRKSGSWMTVWDDRILELMRNDEDGTMRVGELAEHELIRITQSSVTRRCQKLADHGLIKPLGNGVYLITDRGEAYLDGELDTHEDVPDEVPEIQPGSLNDDVEDTA
mgnify:CR=1 FL=1